MGKKENKQNKGQQTRHSHLLVLGPKQNKTNGSLLFRVVVR